jgi:hypothetical protein
LSAIFNGVFVSFISLFSGEPSVHIELFRYRRHSDPSPAPAHHSRKGTHTHISNVHLRILWRHAKPRLRNPHHVILLHTLSRIGTSSSCLQPHITTERISHHIFRDRSEIYPTTPRSPGRERAVIAHARMPCPRHAPPGHRLAGRARLLTLSRFDGEERQSVSPRVRRWPSRWLTSPSFHPKRAIPRLHYTGLLFAWSRTQRCPSAAGPSSPCCLTRHTGPTCVRTPVTQRWLAHARNAACSARLLAASN